MKALTIWQPWASLIMVGAKPFEFRRWPAPRWIVGHRIVIHAGARKVVEEDIYDIFARIDDGESSLIVDAAAPLLCRVRDACRRGEQILPLASGLGTAVRGEPKRATDLFPDSDRVDEHIWGWPLTDIEVWEPVRPARGFQQFWEFPS